MNDMTAPAASHGQTVDLAALYLHPLNTRTEPPALDISTLADSILACGLMQNLLAYADPARPGELGVVAGGRRLRALQLLAGHGEWDRPVPVWVTDDPALAQTWANAENTARTALHPADEIRAYGRMEATGAPALTIAKAFAVTEAHVKRRLKLAHLPDRALDALKAGTLSYGQCAALTLSDDPARILQVLDVALNQPNADERYIRNQLVDAKITANDRRARFVTVDLYEASGGRTTRDLFTDSIWLHDEAVLDTLFARGLEDEADRLRAEGWRFVLTSAESQPHNDSAMAQFDRTDPAPVDLPEGDAGDLEALSEQPYWRLDDEDQQRLAELVSRARGSFDEDARKDLGCLVYANSTGKLTVIDGLKKKTKAKPDADKGGTDGPGGPAPAPEPDLSQALREDFLTIRRAALQTALLLKPELTLDVIAFALDWAERHSNYGITGVSAARQNVTPGVATGLAIVGALQPEEQKDWRGATAADFRAFRDQEGGKKRRNEILTVHFARAVMAIPGDLTDLIEQLAGASVRAIWQPDTANCFSRLPSAALIGLYAELLQPADDDDRFAAFQAMKKKDQARELDDLFHNFEVREAYGLSRDTGARIDAWVPQIMRGAEG